jgi:hypothetical protein
MLGGARIFVDQAAQDGFAEASFAVEVGNGEMVAIIEYQVHRINMDNPGTTVSVFHPDPTGLA